MYLLYCRVCSSNRSQQHQKVYSIIFSRSASFSSYPGVIYSGDDFNVISSSGLVVIETTIGNSNKDLWDLVKPTGQVLEGVRATVANRLAL